MKIRVSALTSSAPKIAFNKMLISKKFHREHFRVKKENLPTNLEPKLSTKWNNLPSRALRKLLNLI